MLRVIKDYSITTLHIFFFRLNLSCCSDVTVSIETNNIKVKANLTEQIQSGKYNLGLPIVPQTFERISVKDKVVTEYVVTEGRKVPLTGLRQTWKKQCFLWLSGNTQRIFRKYFKSLENSGNSVEIDFQIYTFNFLQQYILNGLVYCLLCILQLQLNSSTYIFSWFDLLWLCILDEVIYFIHSFYNMLHSFFLFFYFS